MSEEGRLAFESLPLSVPFSTGTPGMEPMPNETWRFLWLGQALASRKKAQLLVVNEPIFIGSGQNSDANYNSQFERALYDRYRAVLTDFTKHSGIWFGDLWNAVPPEYFTNG